MKKSPSYVKLLEYLQRDDVNKIIFCFTCGGDSMGDTSAEVSIKKCVDGNGKQVEPHYVLEDLDEDMLETIENIIYDHVEFYVDSDGHYMGESGKVFIELYEDDDEGNSIEFIKESTSEYSEHYSKDVECELNEEEVKFFNEYLENFEMDDSLECWFDDNNLHEQISMRTKKDFVLTEEKEKILKSIYNYRLVID